MYKRLFALLLCICVAALSLASCSKGGGETEKSEVSLKFDVIDSAYSSYDSSIVSAYETLSKAVFNVEDTARINTGMYDKVIQLFYTSNPLNVFVDSIDINDDQSGVTVKYKQDKDTVKQQNEAFAAKVDEILTQCKSGRVSKTVFAINAYNYITTNVKESTKELCTAYDVIMTGDGDSYAASNALEYILHQGGIEAAHVLATDAKGAGWGLTLCTLDGENYLLDPMTEYIANSGEQLCYFGMTTEDAAAEGLKDLVFSNRTDATVCDNPYFDVCRMCKSWNISDDNKNFIITRYDEKVVEVAL